jgi:hypothetical protein
VRQIEQSDIFSGDEFKNGVGVAARRNIKTKSEKVNVCANVIPKCDDAVLSLTFCSFVLTWDALSAVNTLTLRLQVLLQRAWGCLFLLRMMWLSWHAWVQSLLSSASFKCS